MNTLVYLASPYSPIGVSDPAKRTTLRNIRFDQVCRAAALLMRSGFVVFCPIAHSHPIEQHFPDPEGGEFWKRQDEPYVDACASMVVLQLAGWEDSSGVQHEIRRARERGIPILYMDPV